MPNGPKPVERTLHRDDQVRFHLPDGGTITVRIRKDRDGRYSASMRMPAGVRAEFERLERPTCEPGPRPDIAESRRGAKGMVDKP